MPLKITLKQTVTDGDASMAHILIADDDEIDFSFALLLSLLGHGLYYQSYYDTSK